jgi:hypothetical protein
MCLSLAGGLLVLACQNPENRAAKERVFSPPPPDPVLAQAKAPVDLGRLVADADYRLKTLSMVYPEVRARAGGGVFTVHEVMELSRGMGSMAVNEEGHIRFNTRGDMDVELKTGTSDSMQVIYANEVLYLRNRNGAWRTSRDPADERYTWADNTYAGIRTTFEMFNGSLSLKSKGQETVDGRKGTALEVSFKGTPKDPGVLGGPPDAGLLPGTRLPDGGALLVSAMDRRRAMQNGEPQSISGVIVMDDALGIPLKVDLEGVMKLPGKRTTEVSTMTIKLQTSLTGVGKDHEIAAPGAAVEEIVRKRVPVNPLEFWDGGPGGAVAAGKAAKAGKEKAAAAPTPPPEEEEAE